ncbi:(S)-ureidoglycine aminohydrolase [Salinisphaera sp. USBA-960]|uniref:bifunctional allantoicase/(S)-ureidoglycine aminohydrolase n=1 Tax=Salinisphaera orenii TaxID=856731 RepID=UPI000DBE9967|nr:(S)-ureidoglycine aminohydrolase [Salifodinibacter halophilus]NNC26503.1 (S)-ureidoglycine aminohydrolase [Salifodinibacter halophilus]
MSTRSYARPPAGLPPQSQRTADRARFTPAYAVIPHGVMRDIVTSRLPHWRNTRAWILARPMTGFAETFAQYAVEVAPGGGSERPEPDPAVQSALFVLEGTPTLSLDGTSHPLTPGSYVFVPAGSDWQLHNSGAETAYFQWIRKTYQPVDGLKAPEAVISHDDSVTPDPMPNCDGVWATTKFVDPDDLRHDMHVTVVTFQPGGTIPFSETHVMEHGLYVLEGKALYQLNDDWVEVEAGDFMWLRAFCPQACYAAGPGPFRYLLYKDVNRHPTMTLGGGANERL